MAALRNLVVNFGKTFIPVESRRFLTLSAVSRIKEIRETKEDKNLIIEAVTLPSPRDATLLAIPKDSCSVCALGLDVKHTDVLILSQFIRSDGCMLPRRITGLCRKQQKRIGSMVTMAQKAGLMPNFAPSGSKKDPKARKYWKKFNTYFDESTIKVSSGKTELCLLFLPLSDFEKVAIIVSEVLKRLETNERK